MKRSWVRRLNCLGGPSPDHDGCLHQESSTAVVQGMTENCLGTEAPQTRKGGDTWSLNSPHHVRPDLRIALREDCHTSRGAGVQPVENLVQKRVGDRPPPV